MQTNGLSTGVGALPPSLARPQATSQPVGDPVDSDPDTQVTLGLSRRSDPSLLELQDTRTLTVFTNLACSHSAGCLACPVVVCGWCCGWCVLRGTLKKENHPADSLGGSYHSRTTGLPLASPGDEVARLACRLDGNTGACPFMLSRNLAVPLPPVPPRVFRS